MSKLILQTSLRRYTPLLFALSSVGGITHESFASEQTLLLRTPALSKDHLAFIYAGDIWLADQNGANPRRLTNHPAQEMEPKFSPDGQWIAFTAAYNNNLDVYIVSVNGGQPKRLTWHPDADVVSGWHPTEDKVLFASRREIRNSRSNQLYLVSIDGSYPEKVMDAVAYTGAFSPDGQRLAYQPYRPAHQGSSGWRLHRGGSTPPIWIISPSTQAVEKIPHPRANELKPMWGGSIVYFISDRDNVAANLFSYDTKEKVVKQLTKETIWDVSAADIYGETIVYEVGGRIKQFNTKTGEIKEIVVSIEADAPQLRAQWKDASKAIHHRTLSPTGKRVLISARGDVFTVPVKDGSTRNITRSDGIREMSAIWSPKGDKIAYISESKKGYKLVIAKQDGKVLKELSFNNTYYYNLLAWGVNGENIIFEDNHLNLLSINIKDGKQTIIARNNARSGFEISLSSDGRWLVYSMVETNSYGSLMLYEFSSGKSTRLTSPLIDASSPSFSPDGKYLYFAASTNSGPQQSGFDMSGLERPLRNGIYALVLKKDGQSPVYPKTGDEEPAADKKSKDKSKDKGKSKDKKLVQIDLEGIQERVVPLPLPERKYGALHLAKDGALFYIDYKQPGASRNKPGTEFMAIHDLYRFDFEKKETKLVKSGIANYTLSHDGDTLLLDTAKRQLQTAKAAAKLETKPVSFADLKVFVNPKKEWAQIFNDAWRMEKEYFYAPNMHGLDWQAVYDRYYPFLDHVKTREDLNRLLVDMIAELQVGHNRVGGGDIHQETPVPVGLLGANLRVKNNRYTIHKILAADRWNPYLDAPLSQPGLDVAEGDYILAINGTELTAKTNIFSVLENTAGKQTILTVGKKPSLTGTHEITVIPTGSEVALRQWNWIEANRKYVAEKTNNQVGYIYIPDTHLGGFSYFNRLFFPQVDKKALIVDERKNNGGIVANYITDVLNRTHLAGWKDRDSMVYSSPLSGVYGPKVMLIDQDAGSGGDFLPYSFRHLGIGKLIGTRTWGGLIGIYANPPLIDGGFISVPFFRTFSPDGKWMIENDGVAPDIEVELEPNEVNRGVDTQLDRAIKEVLEQLQSYKPSQTKEAPAFPTELGK